MGSTAAVRSRVESAAKSVYRALADLERAQAALNDAGVLIDRGAGPVAREEHTIPHPANRGDLERAKKAQARRQGRATKSGDWDEVSG